ncbi:MAG: flagellar filament protein FlaA [Treponema sp.]|nr:MAG: flagellar filament protein FlaA [Treponema sp.]
MKKRFFTILIVLFSLGFVFAQEADTEEDFAAIDTADPTKIGVTSAEIRLKEVSVDKYEVEGSWEVEMSSDEGFVKWRLFDGGPLGKKPIEDEEGLDIPDNMVLGTKVSFYRRGMNSFIISAVKPLPVEGIAKTVSFWVVGRSIPHEINLIVEDYFGKRFELYVGKLNHSGWKLMTVAIPPQGAAGLSGIVQRNTHYGKHYGLKIVGFKINCDLAESYGNYYIYFDDLRAVTDLYDIVSHDADDMDDNW